MRVHVTGVAGLIGSHLAKHWLTAGAEVTASDNFTSGYRDNIPEGVVPLLVGDCTSLDDMVVALRGTDVVYHCAASPHEGLSVFSPCEITNSVFSATVSVMTAAIISKCRRVVTMSSMARYGAVDIPFREDADPKPEDPYGIAKWAAEKEVELLSRIHGIEYVIAVPHNVVGPGQRYDDPYRNVVAIMINRCLQGKPPIVYGDGAQKRCFSHISDAIGPLARMATDEHVVGEVINIGPDEEFVTINELAEMVIAATGFDGKPEHVPPRPQEVKFAYCSSDKSRRLLGYETKKKLADIVLEMVAWIRKRGTLPFDYYLPLEIVNDRTPKTWTERLI
jgi:UDP-glucose 4-epimerase